MNARALDLQYFLKRAAKLLLRLRRWCGVIRPEIADVRFRERHAVHLAVRLERDFIYFDKVRGDHIIGQTFHKLFPKFVLVELDIILEISAQKARPVFIESFRGDPADPQGIADRGFDLGRLDPVTVDLDHVSASAQQDIVPFGILAGKVSAVIKAVPERFLRLLRKIDIPADIRILKTEFACLPFRHHFSVLVQKPDLCAYFRFSDRADFI